MLPKENRLKKKKDFDRVFSRGKALSTLLFLVRSVVNDLEVPRFGFILSKKVSNKAVVRNRIRRVVRGAVEKKIDKEMKGIDVIFTVKSTVINRTAVEIRAEVNRILDSLFQI